MTITPDEWVELEAAAHNGGSAYVTYSSNDMATPIINSLVEKGLMAPGKTHFQRVLTDAGRALLAADQPS